jgi:hypothetical protein
MFKALQKRLPIGGQSQTLPGSYHQPPTKPWNFWRSKSFRDGSASSIHTAPTLKEAWKRSSTTTKASWIAFVTCALMIWMGWRWARYYAAGFTLNCHSVRCELTVKPLGWGRRVHINDVSRQQVITAFAVKTLRDGTFVTDQNISLTESYSPNSKRKYKTNTYNYKGPDENGHYLSYALVLSDVTGNPDAPVAVEPNREAPSPAVSLERVLPFVIRHHTLDGKLELRLIPRRFGVLQSKRRVRTMINKIDSYVRRRRHNVVIRENSPPSVVGVLLMVFGFIGLIVALILGQFQDPVVHHSGPGVRRMNNYDKPHSTVKDTMRSTTPSQYEVSTRPAVVSGGYRRSTTTARKRGT